MLKQFLASKRNPYIPGDSQWEELSFNLSGNILKIRMPPNSIPDTDQKSCTSPVNIYDRSLFTNYDTEETPHMDGSPSNYSVFRRAWGLYGKPWQSTEFGTVYFYLSVFRSENLPNEMSCFNPNHFQQVLRNDMYYMFGPPNLNMKPISTPVNYRIFNLNEVQWFSYEAHTDLERANVSDTKTEKANFERLYLTPLDSQYYLVLSFVISGYSPIELSNQNTSKLIQRIENSLSLQLSQEALKAQAVADRNWPNSEANPQLNPETWTYHKFRFGNTLEGEKEKVITEHGTPPPQYSC